MKIYGAGSLEEIKKCHDLGVEGILTNPQVFEKSFKQGMTLKDIAMEIVKVTDLPVFMQIHGESVEEITAKAEELYKISDQLCFKIIANTKGFYAIRELQKNNIRCIATAVFSVSQAAAAATVGAFGICPFIARMRDVGIDIYAFINSIKRGYEKLKNPPQIISASLRNTGDVEAALYAGTDAVTLRFPLLSEVMDNPLSLRAEILFGKNWRNIKGENVDYLKKIDDQGIAE